MNETDRKKKNAYMREYNRKNADKKKERDRLYYVKNREKVITRVSAYSKENSAIKKVYLKNYYATHKDSLRPLRRQYIYNKYHEDLNYRLTKLLRGRLHKYLKKGVRPSKAVHFLGCSLDELRLYIEGQFLEGMSWSNWSKDGWHIDHIRPLTSFDLTDEKQLLEAVNYKNLQPLWAEDNWKKNRFYL